MSDETECLMTWRSLFTTVLHARALKRSLTPLPPP
jgi:hypothetical protein